MEYKLENVKGIRSIYVNNLCVSIYLNNNTDYIPTVRGKINEYFTEYRFGNVYIEVHHE